MYGLRLAARYSCHRRTILNITSLYKPREETEELRRRWTYLIAGETAVRWVETVTFEKRLDYVG